MKRIRIYLNRPSGQSIQAPQKRLEHDRFDGGRNAPAPVGGPLLMEFTMTSGHQLAGFSRVTSIATLRANRSAPGLSTVTVARRTSGSSRHTPAIRSARVSIR